ncbi:extracellular solute-binding protein [Pedobacter immunditicola]|uniref:extracellular solute-binding protein n=1 Tax=Pedobacter immunditicola TaxID=3133440 RepID=UPI0030AFB9C0
MIDQNGIFKIAVRKFDAFESATKKIWEKFCLLTGCNLKLEMVVMDLPELHGTTLKNSGLRNGSFDIAHINTDWIYEGYLSHAFEELNGYIQANPPSDFPEGWSDSLLGLQQFDGKIMGLPFHDGPECLIYRKDLFEDIVEQEKFLQAYGYTLQPPKTWAAFQQIARFFNRPEENLYGSVFACYPDGHNAVFDFCLQLWSRSGTLINEMGQIDLNTPAASAGLTFYRELIKDKTAVHPNSLQYDSVGAGMAFARGEAAMMINWFGFAAMCDVDQDIKVNGQVGVDLIPAMEGHTSASLNVYWLYTIGSGSKHKQVAYDFIKFAISEENDKRLTLEGGIGCRISTWMDKEVNSIVPYYHKLEQFHQHAKTLPQSGHWSAIAAVIDKMVWGALTSTVPAAEILRDAQDQINSIQK